MKPKPSAKSLTESFGPEAGLKIRKLLDNRIDPTIYEDVERWHRQAYNLPSHTESVMCAINQIIGGYGVEAVRDENYHVDHYHQDVIATYVNMGDTYNITILVDHTRNDTYYLTTWGDWYELYERRR